MIHNETERLGAVDRFMQLDAGIKKDLKDLVELVARICDVPIAIISIIDDKTQWFKASVGVGDMNSNDRHLSMCQETIKQDDILEVYDATRDLRFAQLPGVVGQPQVRFYAGAPLVTYDGHSVGTLCVIDTKPLRLTELQRDTIKIFTKQIQNLLELNWSTQTLLQQNTNNSIQEKLIEETEIKLKAVFDSSKDIHILVGQDMQVLAYNRSAQNYIQQLYGRSISLGSHLLNIIDPAVFNNVADHVKNAYNGMSSSVEWLSQEPGADPCWLEVSFEPVNNNHGRYIGVAINATDITAHKVNAQQISLQNEALQRIATIQSHELRRPVASIMGLMEVMKLDENYVANSYHPMMEATINELDSKIRGIVRESEQTISNTVERSTRLN